jgi:CRISPR-associated endonuclease/helicase Cas3
MDSFNPDACSEVTDLSALAALRGRGTAAVWLDADIATACGLPIGAASDMPKPIEDESTRELKGRVGAWLAEMPSIKESKSGMRPDEWGAAKVALQSRHRRISVVGGIPFVESRLSEADRVRLCSDIYDDMATEAEYAPVAFGAVTIRAHSERVRDLANEFAANLGLSPAVVKDIAIAAWMHDIGKADPRFQQLLVGGSEIEAGLLEEPLAKSALSFTPTQRTRARVLAGYPAGYRHELVSTGLLRDEIGGIPGISDPDLVLHLVASHHGWCRPFAPPVADGSPVDIVLQHDDVTFTGRTDHGLEKLSSGTAERYWGLCDRYGWWGVALLETIVRLADHRVSEMEAEGIDGDA